MNIKNQENIYRPVVNIHGYFMDHLPNLTEHPSGIRCPCGSRQQKIYTSVTQFRNHLKTQTHQKWIEILNLEKKVRQLENELHFRYNDTYKEKEELWYQEMYPEKIESILESHVIHDTNSA